MSDRRKRPNKRDTLAAAAAIFVYASIFATPVLAAPSSRIPCPEAKQATLEVRLHVLDTEFVTQPATSADPAANEAPELASASSLLAPRAEAAIRYAFSLSKTEAVAGTDSESETVPEDDESAEPDSGMHIRLPGISVDDFSRYRKQMYRRDI